jgi:hypothetical protein
MPPLPGITGNSATLEIRGWILSTHVDSLAHLKLFPIWISNPASQNRNFSSTVYHHMKLQVDPLLPRILSDEFDLNGLPARR